MSGRLRPLRPNELDECQRRLYGEITTGRRGTGQQSFSMVDADGALVGPFNAMLLAPVIGNAQQELGLAVRYGTRIAPRVREMIILIAAYANGCGFEQWAHEAIAKDVGVSVEDIESLRQGSIPQSVDDVERCALEVARAIATTGTVTDEQYATGVAAIGERGVFEITVVIGYYACLAMQMSVFEVERPDHD